MHRLQAFGFGTVDAHLQRVRSPEKYPGFLRSSRITYVLFHSKIFESTLLRLQVQLFFKSLLQVRIKEALNRWVGD